MPQRDTCWKQTVIDALSNDLRKANDLLDLKMEETAECKLRLALMQGMLKAKNQKIRQLEATIRQLRGEDQWDDDISSYSLRFDDLLQDSDEDSLESSTIDSVYLTKEKSSRTLKVPTTLVVFSEPDLKREQSVSTLLPSDSRHVYAVPKAA